MQSIGLPVTSPTCASTHLNGAVARLRFQMYPGCGRNSITPKVYPDPECWVVPRSTTWQGCHQVLPNNARCMRLPLARTFGTLRRSTRWALTAPNQDICGNRWRGHRALVADRVVAAAIPEIVAETGCCRRSHGVGAGRAPGNCLRRNGRTPTPGRRVASFAAPLGHALFGTSRQLVVGPTSATAAKLASLVAPLAVTKRRVRHLFARWPVLQACLAHGDAPR
jgi:hypothetical protein